MGFREFSEESDSFGQDWLEIEMKMNVRIGARVGALFSMVGLITACCRPNIPTGTLEIKYFALGPSAVIHTPLMLCCDSKNNAIDVFYPADLDQSGSPPRPVLTWGNGSFGNPDGVKYFLTHLASWGFVIVATRDSMTGNGHTLLDALDLLRREELRPSSVFHNHLALNKIGALGHSQGAGGALNATIDSGGTILTVVTIEPPAHKWCLANLQTCPDARKLTSGSVFFVDGSEDTLISPPTQPASVPGQESVAGFYAAVPTVVDKLKATLLRANHNDIAGRPKCPVGQIDCCVGVNGYLGYITAWLVDRLQGDASAHAAFVQGTGELFSQTTNWEYVASNIL